MPRLDEEEVKKSIISALRQNPRGLTIADFSKLLVLNRATIAKYIMLLVGLGIIDRRKVGPATLHYLTENFVHQPPEGEVAKKERKP